MSTENYNLTTGLSVQPRSLRTLLGLFSTLNVGNPVAGRLHTATDGCGSPLTKHPLCSLAFLSHPLPPRTGGFCVYRPTRAFLSSFRTVCWPSTTAQRVPSFTAGRSFIAHYCKTTGPCGLIALLCEKVNRVLDAVLDLNLGIS